MALIEVLANLCTCHVCSEGGGGRGHALGASYLMTGCGEAVLPPFGT